MGEDQKTTRQERIERGSPPPRGLTEARRFLSIKSLVLTTGLRVCLSESVCVCVPRWLKVMVCINREGICASVLSWIFFLRFIDFYLAASPRTRRQIACACVCLCLTCGTPAQTAVSMARAASCHRKAGLPELRAPLQLVCVHSGFLILDILQHHRRVKVHTFINKWRKWVSYSCSCISATFYFGTKLCPRSVCLRKSNC